MMGIQEISETPAEAKKPLDKKKYIVVKNHVREIQNQKLVVDTNNTSDQKTNKKQPKVKKNKQKQTVSSSDNEVSASGICENDLEELRTVYNKCKAVVKKIETKYGHLLQIGEESGSKSRKRRLSSAECQCILKKKIIYDDEGKQVHQDVVVDHHICPSNFSKSSYSIVRNPEISNLNIEYENSYELPEDLQELTNILKDPELSKYIRYQVTRKIRRIRQENIETLRFDKPNLIQKLKSNCDDILEFKGSNLSSLSGYPVDKKE